ncbi:hypothetical protein BST81_07655 [Leptolyngbya sp. 'hensonii']|uniref:NfeD family protein n=1 Tax=Leptolyngbya sp. 'hensonii' TaxID=1922337 RepID=UPI00094F9BEC|nr:NfeD family protein [Leptolyngbya sp. 'hensonii']OLP19078.1 hypothetical protein BST81_07655 [Leptolyngbya sp. 'hensonii']
MPLSLTLLWLIAGIVLCTAELFLPTAFVAFVMGISALLTALVSLVLPQFGLQVLLFIGLSIVLIWVSRRFIPDRKISRNLDAVEARTLTEIPAGDVGRVIYEGNSWQARCEDERLAIGPNQKVLVVGRRGNTLLVMPEALLHS